MSDLPTNRDINILKNPEFWRQVSKNNTEERQGEDNFSYVEPKKEFWDSIAKGYDDLDNSSSYLDIVKGIIEMLKNAGAVGSDKTALDVGCGTGNYAIRLSKICKEVTGFDISDKMLSEFREKAEKQRINNINIINSDWKNFDLVLNNFEKSFDLVFASMTPLTRDTFLVDKMLDSSKGFVGIVAWAGGKSNQLVEEICLELWGKSRIKPPDMITTFNYLYSLGYAPDLKFFWGKWEKTRESSEHTDYIIRFLENTKKLDEYEKKFINEKIKKIEKDGKVTSYTDARIAFMLVDVLKKNEV